ncbi:propionate kinase [Pseudomonas alcaligenes]|uniref:Acetate kinase n=1 Tax=Aquipseudomonas alcaligenes TaxID=43263 RepID=A0ABR7RWP2_AQUAC|nr:acetate kinase [Pseudomonas alcaligenes]MBC9249756.1 propionate kinase [Pseudomonas alcaligenes]
MSARNILVINCGSSSLKFALISQAHSSPLISGLADRLGSAEASLAWWHGGSIRKQLALPGAGHTEALERVLPLVDEACGGTLHGIGHRVVHGGEHFTQAALIDAATLAAIQATVPLAPLHNPAHLLGIEAAMRLYPQLPHIAVFDTAFHQSMPEHAFRYAIPEHLYREHSVRRYGFHGTSHRYVSLRAAQLCGLAAGDSSWLTAHLGNGCSTCAVVDGQSRDTSMGLTPLEGLVMGSRSGDVDPNLHGHLARSLGWSLEEIERLLNSESGLLGLSGLSNDMRSLEQARQRGHRAATLAIEVFCYRLAKSLAALACALPRLDGLVFTGGIGENSALVRAKSVGYLGLLGLAIDKTANARCIGGVTGSIHTAGSPRILVVPTNEEKQIAEDTLALLDAREGR